MLNFARHHESRVAFANGLYSKNIKLSRTRHPFLLASSSLKLPYIASISPFTTYASPHTVAQTTATEKGRRNRVQEIRNCWPDPYPRLSIGARSMSCEEFLKKYEYILPNESEEQVSVVIYGRIRSQRTAGSKLIFFDVVQDGHKVQILCNQRISGVSPERFREFYHLLQRGDVISIKGRPHRTRREELSVEATELPKLLTPCLHDVPLAATEQDILHYERHVQLLSNPPSADLLRARSSIIQYIRNFLLNRSFIEVTTPVLASAAGGAIAQPFHTRAAEFPERQLSLRIAPELWLKRLMVGGFDKVFEIGPSFRNEGLDTIHNPEFTTCEFYHAFADLDMLTSITESFFLGLADHVRHLTRRFCSLNPAAVNFATPFRRIDFIPALESSVGRILPDLGSDDAHTKLVQLFGDLSLPIPAHPTLPRLLDKLCCIYLEPQCQNPTFIINPPECLSPLSKSHLHPTCNQIVAARAELFVGGKEIVNTYEEENSPFEQRRKFQDQLLYRHPQDPGEIDESYLQALEWGLPPTGGWGCGIDRLCMLFTGARRIGDVLSFGNLRSVTGSRYRIENGIRS